MYVKLYSCSVSRVIESDVGPVSYMSGASEERVAFCGKLKRFDASVCMHVRYRGASCALWSGSSRLGSTVRILPSVTFRVRRLIIRNGKRQRPQTVTL